MEFQFALEYNGCHAYPFQANLGLRYIILLFAFYASAFVDKNVGTKTTKHMD